MNPKKIFLEFLHERAVSQSKTGFRNPIVFFKHYRNTQSKIRRWAWRNHMFTIVKNDFGWNFWKSLFFVLGRQVIYFGYTLFFQPKVLGAIPDFLRGLPKMLEKRKIIQAKRKLSSAEISKWFN